MKNLTKLLLISVIVIALTNCTKESISNSSTNVNTEKDQLKAMIQKEGLNQFKTSLNNVVSRQERIMYAKSYPSSAYAQSLEIPEEIKAKIAQEKGNVINISNAVPRLKSGGESGSIQFWYDVSLERMAAAVMYWGYSRTSSPIEYLDLISEVYRDGVISYSNYRYAYNSNNVNVYWQGVGPFESKLNAYGDHYFDFGQRSINTFSYASYSYQ